MNPAAFTQLIRDGQVPRVLLLHGEEEYQKDQLLKMLIGSLIPEGLEDLNCRWIDGDRATPGQIRNACATLPMMAPRQVVIVRDYVPLMGRVKKQDDDDAAPPPDDGSETLAEEVEDHCCLVFRCRGSAAAKEPLTRKIVKMGGEVKFTPLGSREGAPFVVEMAESIGKKMTADDAEFLLTYGEGTLLDAWQEVHRLAAYVGDAPIITAGDIQAVVAPSVQYSVFRLADQLARGQIRDAMATYQRISQSDGNPYGLLALLTGQLAARMWAVSRPGWPREREQIHAIAAQIAPSLGVRDFVIESAVRSMGQTDAEGLRQAVAWCADTDRDIKAGLLREDTAMELLVLRIAKRLSVRK